MKPLIKFSLFGLLLAIAPARTIADTTNYWVQPVTFTLTAYVQVNVNGVSVVDVGALSTKQFLGFLSGITNPAVVAGYKTNYVAVTNTVTNTVTMDVTNAPFLPTNDFPAIFNTTTPVVFTVGTNTYTDDVSLVCTETGTNPPTYLFTNWVVISNAPAYIVPSFSNLISGVVTAMWLTNDETGTVFALSGDVTNTVAGTQPEVITNYALTPLFTNYSGAKLVWKAPIVTSGTNAPQGTNVTISSSDFVVRYTSGKTQVDYDVQAFFSQRAFNTVAQSLGLGVVLSYGFDEIYFNTQAGTEFDFLGFDAYAQGPVYNKKGQLLTTQAYTQRKLNVSNYSGTMTGQVVDKRFNNATTVVTGTITFGAGKVE